MEVYAIKLIDIDENMIKDISSLLDLKNKQKIIKFVQKKDKIRTLMGELLVKHIIMKKIGTDYLNIKFRKNEFGKPYLEGYCGVHFNLSHSGDYVVCAFDNKPVGIDIEEIKDFQYHDIAEKYFTLGEAHYIFTKDLNNQLDRFYEIWTLKESYVKCLGLGLSVTLDSFSIAADNSGMIKEIIENGYEKYSLKRLEINKGYKMAVCSLNSVITDDIIMVDQNLLITKFLQI